VRVIQFFMRHVTWDEGGDWLLPFQPKLRQREICAEGIFGTQFSTACPYWWAIPF